MPGPLSKQIIEYGKICLEFGFTIKKLLMNIFFINTLSFIVLQIIYLIQNGISLTCIIVYSCFQIIL